MKKYQIEISGKKIEVFQDEDGKFLKPDFVEYQEQFGTALKPSYEPIIVARKPFKGSLVDNVIKNGVGGINIDECRVENDNNEKLTRKLYNNPSWKNSSIAGQGSIDDTADRLGRFPANTILTYDENDFEEVCGGFPNSKGKGHFPKNNKNGNSIFNTNNLEQEEKYLSDSGSASRYFMDCKYTGKDEEIWKQLLVDNVGNNSEILEATKESIAQINVEDLLKELKNHYAKYVDNQLNLIETPIVQDIVEMLTWDFKIETSQVIQDFIINSKKCIQFLDLVQFVEKMDNIDTTQTTQNLLKLFGYVKVVITNYIQGNIEFDQKRYIYAPKASKKDRDEGLEDFEERRKAGYGYDRGYMNAGEGMFKDRKTLKRNIHPTVKPTSLMQYLVRLVAPKGATILDPFMGSGSTGKAVAYENRERNAGYSFIGIEKDPEYCDIAQARIAYVAGEKNVEKSS